jgi:hypothetical protein
MSAAPAGRELTADQVRAMPAGREMDEHVAAMLGDEPTLDWNIMNADETSTAFHGTREECERFLEVTLAAFPSSWLKDYHVGAWRRFRPYSTEISAAWAVVERVKAIGNPGRWLLDPVIVVGVGDGAFCEIREMSTGYVGQPEGYFFEGITVDADTPALAICRAALLSRIS